MRNRKRVHRDQRPLCSAPGPEDGIDPRLPIRGTSPRRGGRKTLQLCSQVAETLSSVLAGECGDEVLRDLTVVEVMPAPDERQLLVTLAPAVSAAPVEAATVLEHLHNHAGQLRSEVARAIHRKRAPELIYRL